jgi:hypothetical protein
MIIFALTLALAGARLITETLVTPARAAGAFAIGKCGAYGQAYDFAGVAAARAAALKQCKGECTAVTMKRACAALSIDMANPCGAHESRIDLKFPRSSDYANSHSCSSIPRSRS